MYIACILPVPNRQSRGPVDPWTRTMLSQPGINIFHVNIRQFTRHELHGMELK